MSMPQVIHTWFGNEAPGYAKGDSGKKSKVDTHGHTTSVRSWSGLSICGSIHLDRVSEEQLRLSGGGEKNIAHYKPALSTVWGTLSAEDKEECENLAKEWNTTQLPEDVQWRLALTSAFDNYLSLTLSTDSPRRSHRTLQNGCSTCRTRLGLSSSSLPHTQMQMGNYLLRGLSVVCLSVLATFLTFAQGMNQMLSVFSPCRMNIGKVQTILQMFGLSSLKV